MNNKVASSLKSEKGSGRSLSEDTRSWMESRLGADFSNVKIHTDSSAVQLNRDLNAQAFTHGSDIYFNQGKFAPGTSEGKRLLAHELTHVVQQKRLIRTKRMINKQNYGNTDQTFTTPSPIPSSAIRLENRSLSMLFRGNELPDPGSALLYRLHLEGPSEDVQRAQGVKNVWKRLGQEPSSS